MLWTCFTYLQLIPLIFTFSKCWGNPLELIGSKQICRCRAWTCVVYSEISFLYLIIAEMVGQAQSCAWGENHIRNFRPAIIQETNLRKKKKKRESCEHMGYKGKVKNSVLLNGLPSCLLSPSTSVLFCFVF